jgi:predicted amino acid-binding ACT domain protein
LAPTSKFLLATLFSARHDFPLEKPKFATHPLSFSSHRHDDDLTFLLSRPGMLASISEHLAQRGLSIENVTTEVQRGKGGRQDFVVNADCVVTSYMDHEHLQAMLNDLHHLKKELGLDICDIRVQRLVPEP